MSSSYSPCAACKFLRRKCTQECVFAPYFPPDQPQRFANVHKVFGASNVSKLLNDLNPIQRQDAVNSLAYEAEARLHDPVYGCVGLISLLQKRLKHIQNEIFHAKKELAGYIGPSAMLPMLHLMEPSAQAQAQDAQQLMQAQQMAEQEMMLSNWDQQQLLQQQMLFGYEAAASGGGGGSGSSSGGDRFQLALGVNPFDLNGYHQIQMQQQQQQQQQEPLLLLQQSTTVTAQPPQQKPEDEHKGPLLVLQQPDTVTPQQQQQHERLLLSQQPATVAVQQHGLGEIPQGIPQQLQLSHHFLLEPNQNFESQENDNTAGPSC